MSVQQEVNKNRISCLNSDSNGLDMSSDHYSSIVLSLDVEEKTNGNITKIFLPRLLGWPFHIHVNMTHHLEIINIQYPDL